MLQTFVVNGGKWDPSYDAQLALWEYNVGRLIDDMMPRMTPNVFHPGPGFLLGHAGGSSSAPNNANSSNTCWFGSVKTWVVDHVGWKGSVDFTLPLPNVFGKTLPGSPHQYYSFFPVGFHLDGTLSAKGLDFDLGLGLGTPISGSFGKLAKGFGFGASTGINVIVYGSRDTTATWDISASGGDFGGGAVDFGMQNLTVKKVDITGGLGMEFGATVTKNVCHKGWKW